MSGEADPTRVPALERFRAELRQTNAGRLERVVLYGSRARGDAKPDSDHDIAVFLHELPDYWLEAHRLADLSTDILYDFGVLIHAMPHGPGAAVQQTPLMSEIRREGLDL